MFASLGLFKHVSCPEQSSCAIPNCIFAHNADPPDKPKKADAKDYPTDDLSRDEAKDEPRKRRRLISRLESETLNGSTHDSVNSTSSWLESTNRPISPPPLRHMKRSQSKSSPHNGNETPKTTKSAPPPDKAVSLNPRLLANPPASHSVRLQLVKMLHEQMYRLNEEVKQSDDPSKTALQLSSSELITKALEEEESRARDSHSVYANVVKLRIAKLRKMKLPEWKQERLVQIAKEAGSDALTKSNSTIKDINTGLTPKQEVAFMKRLLAKQDGLEKHGYVTRRPSQADLDEARKVLEVARGWEQCDRCKARFQVFPGRRKEDGALTSGGVCTYHPAKPRKPTATDKADKVWKDLGYPCCKESVGTSVGCTEASTHVFKISDSKRLDLVMPFANTPENSKAETSHDAVCFDCEMGYTTHGLELIRLTATSWNGDELLDILVRPLGEVLDLNSRFSGVWPKDFAGAIAQGNTLSITPTSNGDTKAQAPPLTIVDSPVIARDLLFSLLGPSTPLIGHAIENDLNAARVIHPSIIDTVLLYPHPKGLPIRFGLKMLTKKHLSRDIQMGGSEVGHDSKEDARAAGELVRWKIKESWEKMRRDGWKVEADDFVLPMTRAEAMKAQIAKSRVAVI